MKFRASKSLGQHFLTSKGVIERMVDAGQIDSRDIVVEAGPGKGVLTESLLSWAREVIAIEKDPRLVLHLAFRFKREIVEQRLNLQEGDVLTFTPESFRLREGGYKVIANIPYYITGNFLRHFLSEVPPPSRMVLLLQKEVARRIVARDGKESLLSLSVKAYGTPHVLETVPKELFTPRPKVDSAVLLIDDISKTFFARLDPPHFFRVLRVGFAQKRKKLSSNLAREFSKESVTAAFERLHLPDNIRAEDVPLSKWKSLAQTLKVAP